MSKIMNYKYKRGVDGPIRMKIIKASHNSFSKIKRKREYYTLHTSSKQSQNDKIKKFKLPSGMLN